MMRCRNLNIGSLSMLMALVCSNGTVFADGPPSTGSLLTIDCLFGTREFEAESLPEPHWSKRSSTFFTLDKATAGAGRDLVRHDPATGRKEILVPASAFVPKDSKAPLPVEGFEFSADELRLLIYTNSKKVWRHNTRGDYWVLDVASRELKKLGGNAAPSTLMFAKLSPDGSRVAFVRENNLYVQEARSLEITALTTDGSNMLINGTGDWVNEEELSLRDCFRWSPDGSHILFWQFNTTGVSMFHLVNNVESNSPRITSFAYPKVGEKNSATRLGVIPVGGGAVSWRNLPGDPREHYLPHAEWTPDGSRILLQQFNRLQTELRVYLADPKSGRSREVITEKDKAWLENENPVRWLDGGKSFLWLSERTGWRHAYRANVDGSPLKAITKGEFDIIEVEAVDPTGAWLYYSASPTNATQRYLFRVKLDGSATEQLSLASQPGWHKYGISPDVKWAVHTWSNFTTPPVVELVRLGDHSVVRTLTDNSKLREKLAALKRPDVEFLKVKIESGVTLDGWSIKPSGINSAAKAPLVMYVYGEPHGQTVRDAWPGSRGLWHWMLAQQGYVVASVDNRGTNVPRGRDWRKSVHRQIGILAPQEQASAVRELVKRWPFVDPARVGAWGWSGGGSMSLNAIFRYPDLYRTAIAIAPVADQRLYNTIYQERYMGLPTDNAKGYRNGSPLTHARNLRGNLLLIHGTGDDNCHYQATERLIDELIAKGKRFNVLPYPNRSHALSEGNYTERHLWETMTRYLRDNLQAPHAPALEPIYATRAVQGWTLHVSRELLVTEPKLTAKAVELLDKQLEEITRTVPKQAVLELQQVPLFFNPEYPGVRPVAEYHPSPGWLRANNRDPAMARSVEFTNIRIFQAETNRMPNFALHELAHAYHDRVLPKGFRNDEIHAAYARAKDSGRYDKVERHFGNGKANSFEKAYAITNPMEYFAETTEAYFSRNDFFPFTRDELKKHDPEMIELLGNLWKTIAEAAPPANPPNLTQQLHKEPTADLAKAADKPLKVFILAGQSNMQGHASISTLDSMADDPKTASLLKEIRTLDGKPRVCEKVWISSIGCLGDAYTDLNEKKGKLTVGFGAPTDKFGPEFTFGLTMEKLLGQPILIIKTSWGGRSLHTDFRSPSAGPYVWSDYELARCKRRGDDLEKIKADKVKATGLFYRHMIEHVRKVLADIQRVVPEYEPKLGYELAGFVWFQGFNDLVSDWTYDKQMQPGGYDLYGELLTHFIRDVRKDLSAPKMPFVIGVMGIGGEKEGKKPPQMYFRQAQAAPAALPEFMGNVKVVQTSPYWDDDLDALQQRMEKLHEKLERETKKESKLSRAQKDAARKKAFAEQFTPEELKSLKAGVSNGGYHYFGAAKIIAPIGKSFAEALVGAKPVKVFVLAGQSNMEGQGFIKADPKQNGGKGSLEFLSKDPATADKFKHLLDKKGEWVVRDDVWIHYLDRKGRLTAGYGAKKDRIGPELGFGHVVGETYEEPVLLIKLAWGGKSLARDFRPPSSGGEVGPYYKEIVQRTKAVLGGLKKEFPEFGERGCVLAGFGWHQGWNDRVNQAFNDEYEKNMANFIRDIRKDLGVKNLPFVIAETGMCGTEEKHPRALSLMKAQAAVAEYEEFKGNVAFVGTKAFWRNKELSPSGQGYHWNTNAETYYLIGEAMGTAMKKLSETKPAK